MSPPTPDGSPKKRRGARVALIAVLLVLAMTLGAVAAVLLTRPKDSTVATSPTAENKPAKSTTTAKPPSLPPDETSTTTTTTSISSNTTTSMTSTDGSSITGIVYLSDMDPVGDRNGSYDRGKVTVNGDVHTRSVTLGASGYSDSPSFLEFDAGRHYKTLVGTVGLPDDVVADAVLRVEIYGDGRPLFNQELRLGQAIPINLDMNGVLRLRLQVTYIGGSTSSSNLRAAFGDMQLQ